MKTIKIPEVYAKNEKNEGDNLTHIEWNAISSAVNVAQKTINNLVDDVAAGTGGSGSNSELSVEQDAVDVDKKYIKINDVLVGELTAKGTKGTNVALSGDNNINIEPRPALGDGEGKNTAGLANRKGGNISLKPGDDIELCSHKRGTKKNTEVAVKVIDGSDNPVKLQVFAGDITLTTKGKNKTKKKDATTGEDTTELLYDDPNVMNVNITTGDGKGYLKVRAQAIDLRCEDHGGIALQPKGNDGEGHMNKIKFEHGGGDGLEFGTFNTEKTSIFTDEYRFNKNGVWKMATRTKLDNTSTLEGTVGVTIGNKKYIAGESDETQHFSYKKADDDFYDFINNADATATTEDIINTANVFNSAHIQMRNGNIYFVQAYVLTSAQPESDAYRIYLDESAYYNNVSEGSHPTSSLPANVEELFRTHAGETIQVADWSRSEEGELSEEEKLNGGAYYTIGETSIHCSAQDIVTLVDYMKTNNQGPWAN